MYRFIILIAILIFCSSSKVIDTLNNENFSNLLGKEITIIGKAANVKIGAILQINENDFIWMDGMNSWPKEYYNGVDDRKKLEVTGTVIEKYDLPVFIYKEGDPIRSGMPKPEGTDLKEASHRYLLHNAQWKITSN